MKDYLLHYQDEGAGAVVVLLHGYMSNRSYWNTAAAFLRQDYRVIRIDLLGFGQSPKPARADYSLGDHVRAVEHTLDTVLGSEHFTLVGHSMGGVIASAYAAHRPDSIKKLILFNMPVFSSASQARLELAGTSLAYRALLYSWLGNVAWPVFRVIVAFKMVHLLVKETYRPVSQSMCTNTASSRKKSLRNVIESANGIEILGAITVPTWLIMGDRDRSIYRKNLSKAKLSDAVKVSWLDAGHHVPLVQPQLVWEFVAGN